MEKKTRVIGPAVENNSSTVELIHRLSGNKILTREKGLDHARKKTTHRPNGTVFILSCNELMTNMKNVIIFINVVIIVGIAAIFTAHRI